MLGPFATASLRTPLFYIAIHQVSLLSHAATVAQCQQQQQRQRVTEGTAMAP